MRIALPFLLDYMCMPHDYMVRAVIAKWTHYTITVASDKGEEENMANVRHFSSRRQSKSCSLEVASPQTSFYLMLCIGSCMDGTFLWSYFPVLLT